MFSVQINDCGISYEKIGEKDVTVIALKSINHAEFILDLPLLVRLEI